MCKLGASSDSSASRATESAQPCDATNTSAYWPAARQARLYAAAAMTSRRAAGPLPLAHSAAATAGPLPLLLDPVLLSWPAAAWAAASSASAAAAAAWKVARCTSRHSCCAPGSRSLHMVLLPAVLPAVLLLSREAMLAAGAPLLPGAAQAHASASRNWGTTADRSARLHLRGVTMQLAWAA